MMSTKMIGDFGQCVETVFGKNNLAASLDEKNLGASPYGIAVVNDHHLDAAQLG